MIEKFFSRSPVNILLGWCNYISFSILYETVKYFMDLLKINLVEVEELGVSIDCNGFN